MSSGLGLLPPSDPPDLGGLESEERIEAMVEWFSENFDDPAQETPYESAEGGYQYIWGGPYNAREELNEAFPEATEEEIEAAADEIEKQGLFDWAPAGIRIQPEDDSFVPNIEELPLEEQLATLEARFQVVEAWLDAVEKAPAAIGHNRPPAEFRILPDERQIAEIRESIAEVRGELAKPNPAVSADPTVIERAKSRFQSFCRLIRGLVLAGAAAFAVGYIEGAAQEAWQDPAAFQEHVASIVETLITWGSRLQLPF